MPQVSVGQNAPSFRLPSAQGGEVGLEDYHGRHNVILLFAKGMACGFCRQKMSQLARGSSRFAELDAQVLMIAPTPVERGRFYAKNFALPFPYLCDPDYRVAATYGLTVRPHSMVSKAIVAFHAMRMPKPETEFGPPKPALGEMSRLLDDDDLGLFVVDKAGTVSYARVAASVILEGSKPVGLNSIPSNDEIVRELERCEGGAPAAKPA